MRRFGVLAWVACAVLVLGWGGSAGSAAGTAEEDDLFWESVSGCTDAEEVGMYVEAFGEGARHLEAARACLERLKPPPVPVKPPPPTEVERLLEVCEMHFAADRLTTGVGGTAVGCYREVQALDPANGEAVEGLRRVFGKYAGWARTALERGDAARARGHVSKLRELKPESPEVSELEAGIARLEKKTAAAREKEEQAARERIERERREREAREKAERERQEREARERAERERREREAREKAERERVRREWSGRVGQTFRDCDACPEMVVVPAGSFTMGSPPHEEGRDDDEGPIHRVTIVAPFAVGRYEVTIAEWDACVAAGGCRYRIEDEDWGRGRRPAINVEWSQAKEYVSWLSRETGKPYRLPTEAEWEYAARAGTETRYSWGDDIGLNRANCNGCGSRWDYEKTARVGSFAANGFGLHDMHGNVWEWVEDCSHGSYLGAPSDGSAWTARSDCRKRVRRGGSWFDKPRYLRSANRGRRDYGHEEDGFRVARTLVP